jgi:soluble lytic murein transglycosylase-like protein
VAPNSTIVNLITAQANASGVPPAIALAVAQQESGFNQNAIGSAGEIGIFQLMPATADSLNVDPSDLQENIAGGIAFLAQLFQKYGSWASALSAYNSGSPTGSPNYANSVLSIAGMSDTSSLDDDSDDSDDLGLSIDPNVLIVGGILLAGVVMYVMAE